MNATLAIFFAFTTTLKQAQIDYLIKRHGVPNLALGCDPDGDGIVLGAAHVVFDGKWFDFVQPDEQNARSVLIVVARDLGGTPVDLVGWSPRDGTTAVHFGRIGVLGGQEVLGPQIAGPLRVHRDVLGWLRAGRRGVVVIDAQRAAWELAGIRLEAEDVDHGLALRKAITMSAPSIMVSPSPMRAAA